MTAPDVVPAHYGGCVRYFNTTGPCKPEEHYMLPAEARLPEAVPLVEDGRYFIVHAPRQTGKTTTMNSLARQLTAAGRHVALRFSCEGGEPWGDDIPDAELAVLDSIRREARFRLPPEFQPPDPWPDTPPGTRLFNGLQDWAVACPLPLVLIFDEIDALQGRSLMGVEPSAAITAGHVDTAKERLILARATHLSSLSARLHEPRIRRFIEPLIAGAQIEGDDAFDEDLRYVRDMGLIAPAPPVRVANPIYREVIARVLSARTQEQVAVSPHRFVLPDGSLDFPGLLEAFAEWWIENGEFMTRTEVYHEAAVQLVFMGFLQRIVNGGGYVDREYGVGRGRVDLLVRKPYGDHQIQREAIELKAWAPGKPDPLPLGLKQLDRYLDRLGLGTGTLVVFDRRPDAPDISERTAISETSTPSGRAVTVLRA